jgi:hypothetical protein
MLKLSRHVNFLKEVFSYVLAIISDTIHLDAVRANFYSETKSNKIKS